MFGEKKNIESIEEDEEEEVLTSTEIEVKLVTDQSEDALDSNLSDSSPLLGGDSILYIKHS